MFFCLCTLDAYMSANALIRRTLCKSPLTPRISLQQTLLFRIPTRSSILNSTGIQPVWKRVHDFSGKDSDKILDTTKGNAFLPKSLQKDRLHAFTRRIDVSKPQSSSRKNGFPLADRGPAIGYLPLSEELEETVIHEPENFVDLKLELPIVQRLINTLPLVLRSITGSNRLILPFIMNLAEIVSNILKPLKHFLANLINEFTCNFTNKFTAKVKKVCLYVGTVLIAFYWALSWMGSMTHFSPMFILLTLILMNVLRQEVNTAFKSAHETLKIAWIEKIWPMIDLNTYLNISSEISKEQKGNQACEFYDRRCQLA